MKSILIILDGLGDRGKITPLKQAETPNLDKFTQKSVLGFMRTLGHKFIPGSDTAHLALFGYDPWTHYHGRGTFEALGAGIDLKPGSVAFRTNMCTVDDTLTVLDRRAGRDPSYLKELYSELDGILIEDIKVKLVHTVEHRGALVFEGPGLSNKITNVDPHATNKKVETSEATKEIGEKTARILNKFTKLSFEKLNNHPLNEKRIAEGKKKANIILSRGAGFCADIDCFETKYGLKALCIAGGALYKGVAKYVGMTVLDVKGATGTFDTNLKAKAQAILDNLNDFDFVFAHIKGTDSCGHDGDFDKKTKMIEKVDKDFLPYILDKFDVIGITGDHSTPCSAKRHSIDPVPFLFYHKDVRSDGINKFSEDTARFGSLGHFVGTDVMPLFLDYLDKSTMFGE